MSDNLTDTNEQTYVQEDEQRCQRLFGYVRDLHLRVKDVCQQNAGAIQSSVDIIKEIAEFMTLTPQDPNGPMSPKEMAVVKFRCLMLEFERMNISNDTNDKQTTVNRENISDVQELILEFHALLNSSELQESLLLFKRAKGVLERVDACMSKINLSDSSEVPLSQPSDELKCTNSKSPSLREKIQRFNKAVAEKGHDSARHFSSCFSSATSIEEEWKDLEEQLEISRHITKPNTVISLTHSTAQSGYEGDVDSELDQPKNT